MTNMKTSTSKKDVNKLDRIKGALYGFAIGDAMGATTEFLTSGQIQNRYDGVDDIIGGGWLNLKAGDVTDDTQMSMCIMEAIMKSGKATNDVILGNIKDNFIMWYMGVPKDVGAACASGIEYMMMGHTGATKDDKVLGNGSLMRALPIALLGSNFVELNILQGRMTHNNEKCDGYVGLYHNVISTMVTKDIDVTINSDIKSKPTGYIVDTFNNVCYWSSKDSFEDCIIGAVNDGGDSDTIAAISGSLSGARLGYQAVPEKWINKLDKEVRTVLDKYAQYVIDCKSENIFK